MNKGTQWLLVALNGLCLAGVGYLVADRGGPASKTPRWKDELEMAAMLRDKGLYEQSAQAYRRVLGQEGLDPKKKGNVQYILGAMYMDQLERWEDALECFYRARETEQLDEETEREADRRIVACLERLDRSRTARLELERSTDPDRGISVEKAGGGRIWARIGSRNITQGEVDKAYRERLGKNPEDASPEEMGSFLRQYVAREVLHNAAARKGLGQDKTVLKRAHEAKKDYMIQAFLEEELGDPPRPSPEELRGYYETNKELFSGEEGTPRPFEEVEEQVWTQLMLTREGTRTSELLERLMKAEDATIFDVAGSGDE